MVRYTIHIPVYDNNGREIPHVLDKARRALGDEGFSGRTVIRKAQGDWQGDSQNYDVADMDLVMVDAPDTPEVQSSVMKVARMVKTAVEHDHIYVTKTPITTFLV